MADLKKTLHDEQRLALDLRVEGITYDVGLFDELLSTTHVERKHTYCSWDKDLVSSKSYNVPTYFLLEHGISAQLVVDKRSPYKIEQENGRFFLIDRLENRKLSDITFQDGPAFYNKTTRDGTSMWVVAGSSSGPSPDKSIVVNYSTECDVKDRNETCLFCTVNGRKGVENEEDRPWRNPEQIGETVKAAYNEGYSHVTITGGFIPERRELEYYLDVAESIKDELGTETFNGTACIGAPLDLHVIERYKEAGFSSVSLNTEVWGKEYFNLVCPGKVRECGGYDNWIHALEYAVQVFGKGNVRSNFVVGLQPKEVLFEGLEKLISLGVVTVASPWVPTVGSPLEGHRTPRTDWHWDVQVRHVQLLRHYGRTYEEIFNTTPARTFEHDYYQIEDETLPIFQKTKVAAG